ncbi:hypothetical protein GP486_008961, partial [Trichoglossum hirsutum]
MGEAARAPERSIDVETSGLNPWAKDFKVLTVALSTTNFNVAFALDHPKAGWNATERKAIIAALEDVLRGTGRLIAHNAPFEVVVLILLL